MAELESFLLHEDRRSMASEDVQTIPRFVVLYYVWNMDFMEGKKLGTAKGIVATAKYDS